MIGVCLNTSGVSRPPLVSDFSVLGGLVQSSSTMGKTYVGLFDMHKQIVALVMWGDSWVGSQKGYFNVYFYPQDHSSASQSSGYIYSSFTKTGRLWWDEFYGGQGAIYSSIDGQGSAYPLVEVDNASRVIRYVGILGYRYQSYGLVDMRIHDIKVVADLTRSNPTAPVPGEPEEYDGTTEGAGPDATIDVPSDAQSFAVQNLAFEWLQSWWPTAQMSVNAVYGIVSFTLLLTIDILGTLNVATSDFEVQGLDFDDPVKAQQIEDDLKEPEVNVAKMGFYLAAATTTLLITSWLVHNWVTFMFFCAALGVWHGAMLGYLWALYLNCERGHTSVEDTIYRIFSTMLGWLGSLLGYFLVKSVLVEKVKGILERLFGPAQAVAMKAARLMMIVSAVMWILIMVWEIGQIASMQSMNAAFQSPSWVV